MNRDIILVVVLAIVLLVLFLASPALAQSRNCGPHALVVKHLAATFGETRRSIALDVSNMVIETFASDSGSWTLALTTPEGVTCIIGSGEYWQAVDEPLPMKGVMG